VTFKDCRVGATMPNNSRAWRVTRAENKSRDSGRHHKTPLNSTMTVTITMETTTAMSIIPNASMLESLPLFRSQIFGRIFHFDCCIGLSDCGIAMVGGCGGLEWHPLSRDLFSPRVFSAPRLR